MSSPLESTNKPNSEPASASPSIDIANQPRTLTQATTGLLSASELSIDRSPRLHTIFENLCLSTSQQLMSLAHTSIELTLERLWSGQLQEIQVCHDYYIIVQFEIQSCQEIVYFAIDRASLFLLLEATLGATSSQRPYTVEREFTPLELAFAQRIAGEISSNCQQAFAPIADMASKFKQTNVGDTFDQTDLDETMFLTANVALDLFNRTAQIRIFMPLSILSPHKSAFASQADNDEEVVDEIWTEHIKSQFASSEVECQAVLEGGSLRLSQIAQLKVGQILQLDVEAGKPIKINCEDKTLYMSELGQSNGAFTVKITDFFQPKDTLLDAVLGNPKNMNI